MVLVQLPAMVSVCTLDVGMMRIDYIYFIDEGLSPHIGCCAEIEDDEVMNCGIQNRKLKMKRSILKMNCGVLGCLNYCPPESEMKMNCGVLECFAPESRKGCRCIGWSWEFAYIPLAVLLPSGMGSRSNVRVAERCESCACMYILNKSAAYVKACCSAERQEPRQMEMSRS